MALGNKRTPRKLLKDRSGTGIIDETQLSRVSSSLASDNFTDDPAIIDGPIAPILYHNDLLQEDIDELRRYVSNDISSGSANMENTFSAPTSAGEFQNGARLAINLYGTSPAATAGTLVSFGNTNVAAVGAQSTTAAATGMITVVTDAGNADELLIEGVVKMSTNTGWSTAKKGAPLYMDTTAGQVNNTAPSTAGEFVRVVGHVIDASNSTIYFNPSQDWIEL